MKLTILLSSSKVTTEIISEKGYLKSQCETCGVYRLRKIKKKAAVIQTPIFDPVVKLFADRYPVSVMKM
jgi:hypothetical protein